MNIWIQIVDKCHMDRPFKSLLFSYFATCGFCQKSPAPTKDCFIYILDSSNSSSLLAIEANALVSEPVTQMALELINNHLISVQQKR